MKHGSSSSDKISCSVAADCENGAYSVCNSGTCEHKALWPLLPQEWIGFSVLGFMLGLANFAGINGGCLLIPVMIALFKFDTTQTIALSNSTTFIGNLTRYFLFSISQKHPTNPAKTLIDHSLGSVMVPMILVGSYIGVLINVLMPKMIIGCLMTGFVAYLAVTTVQKGCKLYNDESAENQLKEQQKEPLAEDK